MRLPPGQHAIDGFPRFGTHLHQLPPAVPANPVMEKVAKSLGVKADRFREYRVRRISDYLAKKPEMVDKLYKDLLK